MKTGSTKPKAKPKRKALPPPDDPLLRHQQDQPLDDRAAAEKRLAAIQKLRNNKP